MSKIRTEIEIDAQAAADDGGLLTVTIKGKPEHVAQLLVNGMPREALAEVCEKFNQIETAGAGAAK